jgi:hypothetical protein
MARKRKHRRAAARAESLRTMGPDPSGRYGVNPYSARGHVVDVAPQELRIAKDSQFPKIVADQRMLDRYKAHKHITEREWKAGNALWELWVGAGNEARVTSGYEPVIMSSPANMDARIAKRIDSATAFLELMRIVPYRSQGVVRAVIIEDWSASDWARLRGFGDRDSKGHGLERLRQGLQALAAFLGH